MDILIKGMEIPKTCRRCMEMEIPVRCRVKEQEPVTAVMTGYNRPGDCPLVELPNNHGRIADLDKVLDWLVNEKRVFSMAMSAKVVKALSDAPVILEASEYECPHYQGVCGLDESIICFSKSNRNCAIRLEASNGHSNQG